jgi:hypothetical protein
MTQQSKFAEYILSFFLTVIIYEALEYLGLVGPIFIVEQVEKTAPADISPKQVDSAPESSNISEQQANCQNEPDSEEKAQSLQSEHEENIALEDNKEGEKSEHIEKDILESPAMNEKCIESAKNQVDESSKGRIAEETNNQVSCESDVHH